MTKAKTIVISSVLAMSVAAMSGCTTKQNETVNNYMTFFSMGTTATLVAQQGDEAAAQMSVKEQNDLFDALCGDIYTLMNTVENSISSALRTSYIWKFNEAEPGSEVELDKTAYDILQTAKSVYEFTGGYYNPAVWYSVDLYGFTTRPTEYERAPYDRDKVTTESGARYLPLPDDRYVQAFKELATHFSEVELTERDGKYYAYKPEATVEVDGAEYSLRLDLGGIGKGWTVNAVDDMLDERGYTYGYFNFGTSSIAVNTFLGSDGNYNISFTDPRGIGGGYCAYKIKNENLSTSGDYENYYMIDGTRYCHIIDPTTGSPVQTGIASATVIGGSAAEDDALTTALMAMGKDKAVEFINDNPEYFGGKLVTLLVIEDGKGTIITTDPQNITIRNQDYTLGNTVSDGKIVLN